MNARRLARQTAYALTAILLLTACASAAPPPTPTPAPTPGPVLTTAQVKYALLDRFGELSWCDPDFYPIAQEDEQTLAVQHLPEIRADADTYDAILEHLGIAGITEIHELTDAQTLAIYREWKLLNAVVLTPVASGFTFDMIFVVNEGLGTGRHVAGTTDQRGTIATTADEDSFLTSCPICLSRGTLIDTPNGAVPVERLRPGDLVWTVDASGNPVAMPLERVGSTPVPASHQVVHLILDDGRELWVSPGHALADGRVLGDVRLGDNVDGSVVVTADLDGYDGGVTFDILPAGATGLYWANGVLLASTL